MSEWNYFVTAQRPGAVTHALGPLRFTSQETADLVVARATRLEVHRVVGDLGLQTVCDVPVNGRLAAVESVRQDGKERDLLVLCTEKRRFAVLAYDEANGRPVALASCSLHDPIGRSLEQRMLCACDASGAVSLYLYEGMLKFLSLEGVREPASVQEDSAPKVFTARIAEPRILDMTFLDAAGGGVGRERVEGGVAPQRPVLASLTADGQGSRALSLFSLDLALKDLAPLGPLEPPKVAAGATKLAVLKAGVLVLGGGAAALHSTTGERLAWAGGGPEEVAAVTRANAEGLLWLLGGVEGELWLLRLRLAESGSPASLVLQRLGTASRPRALVCLPSGRLFVGSALGDSQLLRLEGLQERGCPQFAVEDSWPNLGPIPDFCVADVDDRGQHQVATCSGVGPSGSVRLVRIGIGIDEIGSVECPCALGVWALAAPVARLAVTFIGATCFLELGDTGELCERSAPGCAESEESLLVAEAAAAVLQVTQSGVRAVAGLDLAPLASWTPPEGERLQAAASSPAGVIVTFGQGKLACVDYHRDFGSGSVVTGLSVAATAHLEGEVACIHVSGGLCAVGLWTRRVAVLRLPGLEPVCSEPLIADTIPRSVVFAHLGDALYTFVGLGDGRAISFCVDEASGSLSKRRVVSLGTQPVQLAVVRPRGSEAQHVFASGNRPTLIHTRAASPGQLVYDAVNLRQVSHVASYDGSVFDGCSAFLSEGRLLLGAFEGVQRVHVRTAPLGESPYRITYHQQAGAFVVACQPLPTDQAADADADVDMTQGEATRIGASLRVLHGRTLESGHTRRLDPSEQVGALSVVSFEGDAAEYIAVGIALVFPYEPEPSAGYIRLYEISSAGADAGLALELKSETKVDGAVYALLPFQGMLLGSVNNRVCVWKWEECRLEPVCRHSANILALFLQASKDLVLVGDLMRSASLLRYIHNDARLEEVAGDLTTAWLTATAMLSDDVYLCADEGHNLFTLSRRDLTRGLHPLAGTGAPAGGVLPPKPGRPHLERVGQLHSGEFVNCMRRAALVEQPATEHEAAAAGGSDAVDYTPVAQAVWVSADGAIGLVASLRGEREFARLMLLQEAVSREVLSLGLFPHAEWRGHWSELQGSQQPHKGFIDGDLLEGVLEMPRASQEAVVAHARGIGVDVGSVEDLLREVQELARLH